MLEIPEAPANIPATTDCTLPVGECIEHLECIGKMVKEMHTVLIFLGRKAKEMETTPLGKMLSRFGG